jgi:hypothetical protein
MRLFCFSINQQAKPGGFRWSQPTMTGLLCHQFNVCGIYYYSDISENRKSMPYIGVVIVKPKAANCIISLDANTLVPGE